MSTASSISTPGQSEASDAAPSTTGIAEMSSPAKLIGAGPSPDTAPAADTSARWAAAQSAVQGATLAADASASDPAAIADVLDFVAPNASVVGQPPPSAAQVSAARSRGIIARNFLSLGVAAIVGRLVALLTQIYARRVLGVEAIGEIGWTAAVMTYFALMINPGLETIAKREVARDPKTAPRFVATLFMLQIILAIATFGLVAGFSALKLRGPEISLLLMLQAISLVIAPFNLAWLLQAHERMALLALGDVLVQILTFAALLVFVHSPEHAARYVLLPYPFRIALLCFTFWYVMHHQLLDLRQLDLRPLTALRQAGWLIREAIPLGLSQVAILLYYNSDAIFLGILKGDEAVGYYTTAYSLMTMSTFLSSALLTSYFPVFSRQAGDEAASRKSSSEFLRVLAWIGFPAAALGWALGRHVVHLLFGSKYAVSGPLFEWLSLDIALIFFNIGISQPLIAWGRQGTIFKITLVGAGVNVGLNLIFIPYFGAAGAVITTILAEVAVFIFSIIVRRSCVPLNWLKMIYKPLLCCTAVGLLVKCCVIRFDNSLWPALALGLVALSACFIALERQTASTLLRKFTSRLGRA